MSIKLYSYWRSSAAYRVRIALHLKGLEYQTVPISLAPGESEHRKSEYRAINPQATMGMRHMANADLSRAAQRGARPTRAHSQLGNFGKN